MPIGLRHIIAKVRLCLFVLFALGQMMPSGLALASEDGDFTFVICTMDGAKSVSWQEMTGEPSPFQSENQDQSEDVCHACVMGACAVAGINAPTSSINVATPAIHDCGYTYLLAKSALYAAGPPLPSRAPPAPVLI
ncbi:hypothetical protein [Hyphococcus lacteus]|uniref:DUF2946 domain-containing protein n=1 Tax=Hyphococcus lacteus TaxID=3143536 RepID=A0ABV3Z606_9PROT